MKKLFCLLAISLFCLAQEFPVTPYIDPSQLEVPWPKHSFYKIPWRGFLETRKGYDFLGGIGINYNVPPEWDEVAIPLLVGSGFKTFRIEIGWSNMNWEETSLQNEERWLNLLRLCRKYNVRPTILLNAHHGVPCPVKFFERRVTEDALKGSRAIKLNDVSDIIPHRTGLCNLTDYWACEVFFTKVNSETKECELSKPLPKDLKAGEAVLLGTLKHLPIQVYPPGTPEFEDTVNGWVHYALRVCDLAKRAGIEDFDIEIWNELSFGSWFVGDNNFNAYYDPPLHKFPPDYNFLHPGGHAWELARRTIEAVKAKYPKVRCIWGFSNTTFFHTPIEKLPPMTDGQSYHPYGTGRRRLPEGEQYRDKPELNLEGFTPTMDIIMPEGWAHTFIQTESLMRLLNPTARKAHPPQTERFYHYMTEHGVVPPECGVEEPESSWLLKAKTALRSFCFWLNKGIDVMHYFCAYGESPLDMGLLPTNLKQLPKGARFEDVATLPMKALRNLVKVFSASQPLSKTVPLSVEVIALGEQEVIFQGDSIHPPLWQKDVFAFLPFQCTERKFVIPYYVMTYDATKPIKEKSFRVRIKGLTRKPERVRVYDPLQDRWTSPPWRWEEKMFTIEVLTLDYPRLIVIE